MKKYMMLVCLMLVASVCSAATLEIAPEISHISYREKNLSVGQRDAITVKEDGVFYGLHGIIENRDRVYLAADGRVAFGTVEYSGTGEIPEIQDRLYEVRGLVGYPFKYLVLFTGYGYRYLNDDGEGKVTSTGLFAYERESTYQYVPIGIKVDYWKIPFQAEIDVLITGEQRSNLHHLDPFLPEVINKQNRGAGFKISTNFKKSFKHFDLVLTPFVRGWKIQDSKTDDWFYEPKNTSLEVGGALGIRF